MSAHAQQVLKVDGRDEVVYLATESSPRQHEFFLSILHDIVALARGIGAEPEVVAERLNRKIPQIKFRYLPDLLGYPVWIFDVENFASSITPIMVIDALGEIRAEIAPPRLAVSSSQ